MLSRRKFITYTTLAMGSAAIASGLIVYQWWDTPSEKPYTHLNTKEGTIIQLIAKASFPAGKSASLNGKKAKLDRFFDNFLEQLQPQNRTLLKLLVQATERISFPIYGSFFSNLTEETQQECIENLLNSDHALIRAAYQSLIAILGMGYTTHPQISKEIALFHRCGYE